MKEFRFISSIRICLATIAAIILFIPTPSFSQSVKIYTPYTNISVPPGETIEYDVSVVNDSKTIQNVPLSMNRLPKGWSYSMKAEGYTINRISVLPGKVKKFTLFLDVPFQVDKGTYNFGLSGSGLGYLPLTVVISEKGTYKTEFTSEQPNMEGHTGSNFTFITQLKNSTGEDQLYSLRSRAPRGWIVTFEANFKQATSINIAPNVTENISIRVNPPDYLTADTYVIPVEAVTSTTSGSLDLEVVISGTYDIEVTSQSGLLSMDIVAGEQKRTELIVRNVGSTTLEDINLATGKPQDWEAVYEPAIIPELPPGQAMLVTMTVKASDKAIPGDYVLSMEARTPETTAKANYRITVKTSVLAGWLGILVILTVIGVVIFLFRKYGRR